MAELLHRLKDEEDGMEVAQNVCLIAIEGEYFTRHCLHVFDQRSL